MRSEEAEEKVKQQRLAAGAARDSALRRLRDAHAEEYRSLYNEEAAARGVTPMGARRDIKRARLLRELAKLEGKGNGT